MFTETISKEYFVRWGESCLWEDDDTVKISIILELNTGRTTFIRLNDVQSIVWKYCEGSMTVEGIIDKVTRCLHMDVNICQDSVINLIKSFYNIGILTLSKQKGKIVYKNYKGYEIVKRNIYVDSDLDVDGVTILNNRTNLLAQLDHDWLLLWQLCDGNHTVSQIVSALITDRKDMLPIDISLRLHYLEYIWAISVS